MVNMTHEAAEKHGAVNIEFFIRVKVSNFVPYERPACQILNNIPTKINQLHFYILFENTHNIISGPQ